MLKTKLMV